jgi:hypothetical protein
MKLYLYLKNISDGYVSFDSSLYESWATDIGCSKRWVHNGINWLIKNKWITVNSKRKSLHIVSYEKLCKLLSVFNKVAGIYEPEDFISFDSYCIAIVITFHIRRKAWMDRKRRPVSNMGDATTSRNFYPKGFKTLPIRYLSKCLNVSETTANNYKQKAANAGLLEIKKQITTQIDENGQKLSKDKILVYQQVEDENSGRFRIGRKYLKLVEADLIKSHIIIKSKRYNYDAKK